MSGFTVRAYGARSITSAKIALDTIVNEVIKTDAAIALSKLAATTASRALVSDASGFVSASSVTATELGYLSGVTSAIQTQINNVALSVYRRKSVIALVDPTAAPPTEVTGDRYILDFTVGDVHADWDGATKGQIVTFGLSSWTGETPAEGWRVYGDTANVDYLYIDDGSPAWQSMATASMYLVEGKIFVGDNTNTAVGVTPSGDVTISSAGVTAISSGVIVDADINASAAIALSKLAVGTPGQIIVAAETTGIPTYVTQSGDVTFGLTGVAAIASGVIVNDDINASAGIVDTKLATIATANKVSGSAVQLNADGSIVNSTGLKSVKSWIDSITLVADDITAQYIDGTKENYSGIATLKVVGLGPLFLGIDFSVSTVSNKIRITFLNDLATGGLQALVAGDIIEIGYDYL